MFLSIPTKNLDIYRIFNQTFAVGLLIAIAIKPSNQTLKRASMPKRISANDKRRLNLANIVQRLPLHRQLSAANVAAIKITPIWQRWSKSHLPEEFRGQVQVTCPTPKKLVITCPHAICASQLKHRQENLLAYLQNSEEPGIESIEIRLAQSFSANSKTSADPYNDPTDISQLQTQSLNLGKNQTKDQNKDFSESRKIAANSVQSIESCQQTVANSRLAESLSLLAETLKTQSNSNGSSNTED